MRLEADDGRSEASAQVHGGVQTADRAVVRERQAACGDQDGVRHLPFHPAPVGAGIRNSGSTRATDDRTPGQSEPLALRKRNRQSEMEVDVSEQAAPVSARKQA